MAAGLPPYFEKQWHGSNVVLRTLNSNGKELYANREILGENSSYFKGMFFSGFKEISFSFCSLEIWLQAYQHYVDVPCDYKHMLNILRTIHSGGDYLVGSYTTEDLAEMYSSVDMLDFPKIRDMYIDRIDVNIVTIAKAALKLANHDMLANCLKKMASYELRQFVEIENATPLFCKNDVALVYEKIAGSKPVRESGATKKPLIFPELEDVVKGRIVDLTKEWCASDLMISTRNSDGRMLYANKGVLVNFSEKMLNMLMNDDDSIVNMDRSLFIHLDVDFVTMKAILFILHNSEMDFVSCFQPVLLYDMYRFATEFDLPFIVKFVSDRLVKQATAGCLEVALKLNLPSLKLGILTGMLPSALREWVLSGDDDLTYPSGDGNGEAVTISSKATDLTLSLNDLRMIHSTLTSYAPVPTPPSPNEAPAEYDSMWHGTYLRPTTGTTPRGARGRPRGGNYGRNRGTRYPH